jgi:putative membrane protein
MFLLWGLLLVLALWGVRAFFPNNGDERASSRGEGALDILGLRYARGEISRAEYELMKADLER